MTADVGPTETDLNDEHHRLEALRASGILDTPPEARFDRIVRMAAAHFRTPIALVTLVDADRQWFKASIGLDVAETPRDGSFCDHAIGKADSSVLVIEDARGDPRFRDNPLVVGAPFIRFYAGAVLTTDRGLNLGTLCIIAPEARPSPSPADLDHLRSLARLVVDQIELSQANAALKAQRSLLDHAQSLCGLGHFRYDRRAETVEWSDGVYQIHGLPVSAGPPRPAEVESLYEADDRPVMREAIARSIRTGDVFSFPLRLRWPDGQLRHTLVKGECQRDGKGEATALFGAIHDVTDHVRALAAARDSEALYRLLADNANEMIAQCRIGGEIVFVSPGCRQVIGYAPEDLIGKRTIDFMHPDDVPGVLDYYRRVMAQGPDAIAEPFQFRARHHDGRHIWLEGQPKIFFDPDTAAPILVQDVVRDISSRKSLEQALQLSRREAEAAAAVKSQFLANMSHELRTPLTSIIGFSALLDQRAALDGEEKRFLARIVDASRALLTTVNDILDFSKLEAGQVEIAPRRIDPQDLGRRTLELLEPQAALKGLEIAYDGAGLPAQVLADDDRLKQILLNYLGNAVKFTARGRVVLRARYDHAAQRLRFEVIDTGPGVPANRIAKLFRRFSQVDASTTRVHGGAGLGLAICKGLAEAMGGEVGAQSTVGEGSRFWVDIPAPCA